MSSTDTTAFRLIVTSACIAGILYVCNVQAKSPETTTNETRGSSAPQVHSSGAGSIPTEHKLSSVNSVPLTGDGKTMHLNVASGDVAPRVLSVGDVSRAERIAQCLVSKRTVTSSRGFVVHTGLYKGKQISVVATLMGFPNMDFVVRELHAVVPGPMAILRLGTCGGLQEHTPVGTVVLCKGAVAVRRNPDAISSPAPYVQSHSLPFSLAEGQGPSIVATPSFPYDISGRCSSHPGLSAIFGDKLREAHCSVHEGVGASADSFYSSQGRASGAWGDRNSAVIPSLTTAGISALEMETFHLLDLARSSMHCESERVYAGAASIVIFNRPSGTSLDSDRLRKLEALAGNAALETLHDFIFP